MLRRVFVFTVAALLPLGSLAAESYSEAVGRQRAERTARLTAPEGWLSLVGLHWLAEGEQTVGSRPENGVVLKGGPARFGSVRLEAGRVTFTALAEGVTNDRQPLATGSSVVLTDDTREGVSPNRIRAGSVSVHLVDRGGRKALRVRDSEADSRVHFLGLDYFPLNESWRIEAAWIPFPEPREVYIQNIIGQREKEAIRGEAVFVRDGVEVRLLAIWDGDPAEKLFFVISDATSGEETYGAARFVYADAPKDGHLVLDFNLAVNPPCAFTPFATCPLPPDQNQMPFAIRAGEKRYRGEAKH